MQAADKLWAVKLDCGAKLMATLTRVHEALSPDALHVVFVHGLGGDARSTWMHNPEDHTTLWPNWIGEVRLTMFSGYQRRAHAASFC